MKLRWLIVFCVIVSVAMYTCVAAAQVMLGKPAMVRAPVCTSLASAILIAKADEKGGPAAAIEMLNKLSDCAIGVGQVVPTKVVFTVKTERGTTYVIRISVVTADGAAELYMLTDMPVQ